MGEWTFVASAKRGVRGDLKEPEPEDSEEFRGLGASVSVVVLVLLGAILINYCGRGIRELTR